MKIRIFLSVITLFSCLLYSRCKKITEKVNPKPCEYADQLCDSAMHYLSNYTNETIWYRWSDSERDTSLLPGQTHTRKVGRVEVKYEPGSCEKKRLSWSTGTINSDQGVWAIQLDHCNKKSSFRYDKEEPSNGLIFLHDESE